LDAVAPAVGAGGALVYSVCTVSPDETNRVVDAFVLAWPGWSIGDPRALPRPPHEDLLDGSALRTYPHRHDADAFFGVRLERP
jgi:16S rRNA (cytosine967-C5)-methyltransferase